jgi:hypothetical protein
MSGGRGSPTTPLRKAQEGGRRCFGNVSKRPENSAYPCIRAKAKYVKVLKPLPLFSFIRPEQIA